MHVGTRPPDHFLGGNAYRFPSRLHTREIIFPLNEIPCSGLCSPLPKHDSSTSQLWPLNFWPWRRGAVYLALIDRLWGSIGRLEDRSINCGPIDQLWGLIRRLEVRLIDCGPIDRLWGLIDWLEVPIERLGIFREWRTIKKQGSNCLLCLMLVTPLDL